MSIFLNDWSLEYLFQYDYREKDPLTQMINDFSMDEKELEGVEILLASYSYADYSGSAFVLFKKDGKYYEVHGSHCSCYGLEGQWNPEEADLNELVHRIQFGHVNGEYRKELISILKELPGSRLYFVVEEIQ
jgi:hypothetical protein